jgi:hypothetical protein
VANFNETEQIIILDSQRPSLTKGQDGGHPIFLSFVQTRGSVPVYWAEINNLRYQPDLQVMDQRDTVSHQYDDDFHLFNGDQ